RIDALVLTGATREEAGGLGALIGRSVPLLVAPEGLSGAAAADAIARLGERGARVLGVRPGDTLAWHGIELVIEPGGVPGEVGLELRWGKVRVLAVSSADARNPLTLSIGDLDAIAVGSGTAAPAIDGVSA